VKGSKNVLFLIIISADFKNYINQQPQVDNCNVQLCGIRYATFAPPLGSAHRELIGFLISEAKTSTSIKSLYIEVNNHGHRPWLGLTGKRYKKTVHSTGLLTLHERQRQSGTIKTVRSTRLYMLQER
jgi:hypothetical protein